MTNIAARASLVVAAACALGALAPAAHAEFAYDIEFTGTFEGTDPILKLANGVEEKFRHDFTNTGDEIDLYRMWMTAEYYTGDELGFTWTMCTTDACVLPGVESTVGLAPAESDTVTIKITPSFDQEGSASVTLHFESVGNPALATTFRYSVIREGTDVLILDDDGEAALEQYVAAGLDAGGVSYGVYDTSIQSLADASFGFGDQRYLVYLSGDQSVDTITSGDAAVLGGYLDGGGRLVVSGQDLFDDITGSVFCETYLGTSAIWPTAETSVTGVAGDALGDGLSFSIAAGAMNQVSPDVLLGGIDAFRYADGSVAGVRHETPTYKTVSLGFGLEALAPADVAALLGAAGNWFDAAVVAVPGTETGTARLAASAFPNPMRAAGIVRVHLDDGYRGRLRVSLFDAGGRWIASPFDAVVTGGVRDVAIPTERLRGAGPGVYFYEVVTDRSRISGKLTTLD
jgi:hypothetical protein